MSRFDEVSTTIDSDRPLVDLPLRPAEETDFPLPVSASAALPASWAAADLGVRALALAADSAIVLLVWSAAVLAAGAIRGRLPAAEGLPWAGAFLLFFSFFATVPALVLFGKTLGMAVAGLCARPSDDGSRLDVRQAIRRWLGSLVTAATLGAALLFTFRSVELPTPADRWSGRGLVEEGESSVRDA